MNFAQGAAIYREPGSDVSEALIVYHNCIEKEYVGYIRDVNAEVESTNIALAMLGASNDVGPAYLICYPGPRL